MIVVDAGVVVTALGDDGPDGDMCRQRLRGEILATPALLDLEVLSALRRLAATDAMPARRARLVIDDLGSLPVYRAPHEPLLERCWELRNDLTVYDAAYVALAEALDVPLVTADARLARSPRLDCLVDLLSSGN